MTNPKPSQPASQEPRPTMTNKPEPALPADCVISETACQKCGCARSDLLHNREELVRRMAAKGISDDGLIRDCHEFVEAIAHAEHKLGCDEYHQHQAPKCCRDDCWCKPAKWHDSHYTNDKARSIAGVSGLPEDDIIRTDLPRDAAAATVPVVARPDESIRPPFQRELTVILLPDKSDLQADADLEAIKDDKTTVFHIGVSEFYFHRLRRRVAEQPELIKKIAVFYKDIDDILKPIDLTNQLQWPVDFQQELWDEEVAIQKIKHPQFKKAAAVPLRSEVSAEPLDKLLQKYFADNPEDSWLWDWHSFPAVKRLLTYALASRTSEPRIANLIEKYEQAIDRGMWTVSEPGMRHILHDLKLIAGIPLPASPPSSEPREGQ